METGASNFLKSGFHPALFTAFSVRRTPASAARCLYASMPKLTQSYFDSCGFSGSLPASLGTLTTLETIFFNINNFSGTIPPAFCNQKAPDCRIPNSERTRRTTHSASVHVDCGNLCDCPLPACAKLAATVRRRQSARARRPAATAPTLAAADSPTCRSKCK